MVKMERAGKERLLVTNAKVYFVLELNLNSQGKGGSSGDGTAVVVNKSVKLG